jgi:pfkB family carbohydrate kinase
MQQKLLDTVKQFGATKNHALVIGDVMLDRYLIGSVGRISPEAPVPIVLLNSQHDRAGGAANVAANLALLGIKTHLIGCVGDDNEAKILSKLITEAGIENNCVESIAANNCQNPCGFWPSTNDAIRPRKQRNFQPRRKRCSASQYPCGSQGIATNSHTF